MIWRKTIKQFGFTLIELGITVVILGVLAAYAIPVYIDSSSKSLIVAQKVMDEVLQQAFAVAIVEKGGYPTVTELAKNVQGSSANSLGVLVYIKGVSYIVPTYVNLSCTTPTSGVDSVVQCVGDIT